MAKEQKNGNKFMGFNISKELYLDLEEYLWRHKVRSKKVFFEDLMKHIIKNDTQISTSKVGINNE